MKLSETIENMTSDKWEHRLLGEFKQVAIRFCSLSTWIEYLEHAPDDKEYSYFEVFMKQAAAMHIYALTLLVRLLDTNLEISEIFTDAIFKTMGVNPTTREEMRRLAYKALNLSERDSQ